MKKYIGKVLNLLKIVKSLSHIPDFYWARRLVRFGLDPRNARFDRKSGKIFLDEFEINLSKEKHLFFLEYFALAKNLKDGLNSKFSNDDTGELLFEIGDIKVTVQTGEELYNLNEIFLVGTYNVIPERPALIWDIGMYVGLASLYFATKENVKVVLSYEPFKKTYEQALRNFRLSREVSKKIKPSNYGIGGSNKNMTVEYSYEYKGNTGVYGISDKFKESRNISKEDIVIRNAGEVLESIISEYPGIDIIAKIDCEGSEHEIIHSLYSAGKLSSLKAIMMEWHEEWHKGGPQEIIKCLHDSGFTVFSQWFFNRGDGMIYAVRESSRRPNL